MKLRDIVSEWEFTFEWCLVLAREALMGNFVGEKVDAYVDWVFARHPDLVTYDGLDWGSY